MTPKVHIKVILTPECWERLKRGPETIETESAVVHVELKASHTYTEGQRGEGAFIE
jgi:hypothetical protein